MSLRRVSTAPELAEVASVASKWSESLHQPSLSEATRLQLGGGRGTGFVSDDPQGVATLTVSKLPDTAVVEVAVPSTVSASEFWDLAESKVLSAAGESGFRALELLTWDPELQSRLREQGWTTIRAINRGRINAPLPASGGSPPNVASLLGGETDVEQLIEVNNLAFADHPDAAEWDPAELDKLSSEPWFDPKGLLVTRTDGMLTGFCWTKVHPDNVGEIYLLAVRPGQTGRGLGRELAMAGLDYLKGVRACQNVIVYWDASNDNAGNLYQSIGFSVDLVAEVLHHRL